MLPARVLSRPYNDPEYDRFWAVAEEIGVPLTFHSALATNAGSCGSGGAWSTT